MSHKSICLELDLKCLLLHSSQLVSRNVPEAMSCPRGGKCGGSDEESDEPQQPLSGFAVGVSSEESLTVGSSARDTSASSLSLSYPASRESR